MQEATKKSGGRNRRRNNAKRLARKSRSWAEGQARRAVRREREMKRQKGRKGEYLCRVRPYLEIESIIVQNEDAIPENWRKKRLKIEHSATGDGPRLRVARMGFGELQEPIRKEAASRRDAVNWMKAALGARDGAYECVRA